LANIKKSRKIPKEELNMKWLNTAADIFQTNRKNKGKP